MKNTFKDQGKPWSEKIENSIKSMITELSGELGIKCIHKKNQRPIQKFVKDIEEYLEKRLETEKKIK